MKAGPILVEHLTIVRGQFPAPHVALISVTLPNPDEEEDDYFSALLLGDSSGAISGAVHEPAQRWEAFEVDYLVDLDADGVDEVGFTSAYLRGHLRASARVGRRAAAVLHARQRRFVVTIAQLISSGTSC